MVINFANAALKERESKPPRAVHDGPSFRDHLTPQRASRKCSWEKKISEDSSEADIKERGDIDDYSEEALK